MDGKVSTWQQKAGQVRSGQVRGRDEGERETENEILGVRSDEIM